MRRAILTGGVVLALGAAHAACAPYSYPPPPAYYPPYTYQRPPSASAPRGQLRPAAPQSGDWVNPEPVR
jgi:hypothetical protein